MNKICRRDFSEAIEEAKKSIQPNTMGLYDLSELAAGIQTALRQPSEFPLLNIEAYLLFHSKEFGIRISVSHKIEHKEPKTALYLE